MLNNEYFYNGVFQKLNKILFVKKKITFIRQFSHLDHVGHLGVARGRAATRDPRKGQKMTGHFCNERSPIGGRRGASVCGATKVKIVNEPIGRLVGWCATAATVFHGEFVEKGH